MIVITGSEGFVGRALTSHCRKNGIKFIGIDSLDAAKPGYHKSDIRSKEIASLIPEKADAIIHLAALSRDADCRNKAYECFDINVMGTLNLMKAALHKSARQFIFASSEWVYDSCTDQKKDENSAINFLNHTSEYAISKLVSEANLRQKYRHGFCDVTILRFGITYGPRKSQWSAVESLFNSVKTQDEITVGSLRTGRCFIHVSDIASGVMKAIGLKGLETINLAGDRLVTLGEIIETSKKILGRNPKIFEKSPKENDVRNISNEKAKKLLGWKPEIDLESGLRTLENNA